MKTLIIAALLFFAAAGKMPSGNGTKITWLDHVGGDFSFANKKSIDCDAWCYEWAGTNAITARYKNPGTVVCATQMNQATHCSLRLIITKDSCVPVIDLLSVARGGNKIYPYKSGYIKIDKALWKKRILKAAFSFDFVNDENEKRIFWTGRIYSNIK